MFSFLNPLMLFGFIATAIPLIIHFLTKRKSKKIFFSTVRFLKELEEKKRRRIRIDFFLLLLLRILIIFCFCLALARPLVSSNLFSMFLGKAPRSIVFLVDNSYSMGYLKNSDSLFSLAKKKAIEKISDISLDDEVNIIFFNEKANAELPEFTNNKEILRKILHNKKLSLFRTKAQIGLNKASELLTKSKNPDRIVYILSDFQKNGFVNVESKINGIKIIPIAITPKEVSNLTITDVKFPSDYISAGTTNRISVHLKNFGERKKVRVGLYIEKNRVGEASITLEKDSEDDVVFFYPFRKKGVWTGFAELIGQDNLTVDDRFYFSVEVKDFLKVLLITDKEKDENYYLKQIFYSSPSNPSPIILETISVSELKYDRLKSFSVIILDNISKVDDNLYKMLFSFVHSGGGIFLCLGKDVSIENYNRIFFSKGKDGYLLPAKIMFKIGTEEEVNKFFTIASFDKTHPIFKIFSPQSFSSTHFYSFYSTELNPMDFSSRILARFDDGLPAFVEKKIGLGKIIFFTSSLDTNWSDFPLRPNYLPLLHQVVYYLAKPKQLKERMYILGDEFPENSPGITLRAKPDDYIVFNLNREESDMTFLAKRDIENIFEPGKDISQKMALGSGDEITTIFLLFTLFLLIVENMIANREKIALE